MICLFSFGNRKIPSGFACCLWSIPKPSLPTQDVSLTVWFWLKLLSVGQVHEYQPGRFYCDNILKSRLHEKNFLYKTSSLFEMNPLQNYLGYIACIPKCILG